MQPTAAAGEDAGLAERPASDRSAETLVARIEDAIVIVTDDDDVTSVVQLVAATLVDAGGRPVIVLRRTAAGAEMLWASFLEQEARASTERAAASPARDLSLVTPDGRIRLDVARRTAVVAGEFVELTRLEFDLLACFMSAPGQALSRTVLLERVWGFASGGTHTITVHVRQLRAKIEPLPRRPRHIHTIRGVGYRFEP